MDDLDLVLGTGYHQRTRDRDYEWKVRKLARATGGYPQVVVHISGLGASLADARDNMDYVEERPTEEGTHVELVGVNELGAVVEGAAGRDREILRWSLAVRPRSDVDKRSVHMALSMPGDTPPAALWAACQAFSQEAFGRNHRHLMVLHLDSAGGNPHVHFTVDRWGKDGRVLRHGPEQVQHWRDVLADKLWDQGIECSADRRFTQGVIRRGITQKLAHVPDEDSRVVASKNLEALREAARGERTEPVAERLARRRIEAVRAALGRLQQTWAAYEPTRPLAEAVQRLVERMPPAVTERQERYEMARAALSRTMEPEQVRQQGFTQAD